VERISWNGEAASHQSLRVLELLKVCVVGLYPSVRIGTLHGLRTAPGSGAHGRRGARHPFTTSESPGLDQLLQFRAKRTSYPPSWSSFLLDISLAL